MSVTATRATHAAAADEIVAHQACDASGQNHLIAVELRELAVKWHVPLAALGGQRASSEAPSVFISRRSRRSKRWSNNRDASDSRCSGHRCNGRR